MDTDQSQPQPDYPVLAPPISVPMVTTPEQECPYLPPRMSQVRAFCVDKMPGLLYQRFMDAGFRRSGKMIYQPVCNGCRACVPIRVPVARFIPTKSQRRCWKKNQDLVVSVAPPRPTDEKYDLYQRYLAERHGQTDDPVAFKSFLYDSPVETIECDYRTTSGRLLAIGICDWYNVSLSSVYYYYDPSEKARGLGIFGAMYEIELARQLDAAYYYLGYWVDGCSAMQYKSGFRPNEMLCPDGNWQAMK